MKPVQLNFMEHLKAWHDWDTPQNRANFWKNTALLVAPALILIGLFTWQTFSHSMKLSDAQVAGVPYSGDVGLLVTFGVLALVYTLCIGASVFAGTIRRLKDVGVSPAWSLLLLLGFWGWLILSIFLCQPSGSKD